MLAVRLPLVQIKYTRKKKLKEKETNRTANFLLDFERILAL